MSDWLSTFGHKAYCFRVSGEVLRVVADNMSEENGGYVLRRNGVIVGKIMEGVSAWWIVDQRGEESKKFGCATVLVSEKSGSTSNDRGEFEFGVIICTACRSDFDDVFPLELFERSTADFEEYLSSPTPPEAKKLLSEGVLVGPCCVRCGANSQL